MVETRDNVWTVTPPAPPPPPKKKNGRCREVAVSGGSTVVI